MKTVRDKSKIHIARELTELQKKVFDMTYLDNMKQQAVADKLGISRSGVSLHLTAIKKKINISEKTEKS